MIGIFVLLAIVVIVVIGIFIKIKIGNLKYRAKQQLLGQVGLSSADINANINNMQEQRALTNFLNDYPNYTEKTVKDTFYGFALSIINGQNNGYMSEKTLNKMAKDNLLSVFRTLNFVRINILGYSQNRLSAVVVFANSADEYQIIMNISIQNNLFYIDSYDSMKGMTKGF